MFNQLRSPKGHKEKMDFGMSSFRGGGGGGGEASAFHQWWDQENITRSILKCTSWQLEETTDFITCPYHYYCNSQYQGDYPSFIDVLVSIFATYCFLSIAYFTILELTRSTNTTNRNVRRKYLLPSGPFLLPLFLLTLAKGQRTNTLFPLSHVGPALLQLLQVSALAFRNEADGDVRYAVLEASTVSGILHASLYLDAIILPYFTGLEALRWSRFSGECASCICRMEPLVVGGTSVLYRGLSKTTLSIIFALCSRMVCRIYGEERLSVCIRSALEGVSWVLLATDSVYLMSWVLREQSNDELNVAVFAGVCFLIFLSIFSKFYRFLVWVETRQSQKPNLCHNIV